MLGKQADMSAIRSLGFIGLGAMSESLAGSAVDTGR